MCNICVADSFYILLQYLLCISHSLAPILISHTHTNPSSPPLTIFQSSAWTEVTPKWWAYREATEEPVRRSNTLTLNHSRKKQITPLYYEMNYESPELLLHINEATQQREHSYYTVIYLDIRFVSSSNTLEWLRIISEVSTIASLFQRIMGILDFTSCLQGRRTHTKTTHKREDMKECIHLQTKRTLFSNLKEELQNKLFYSQPRDQGQIKTKQMLPLCALVVLGSTQHDLFSCYQTLGKV